MDDARRDGAADLLLLSEEELLLERADALLARGGVERSEHAPEPERYRYVRRASSVDSRRSLVRRFLTHKWSIKTREAAIVKTSARPIATISPFADEDA